MVVNRALQMMKEGKPAFGYALGMGSPYNAELISQSGIDFTLLDRQHGTWGDDSTNLALAAMHGNPATPMVRVARNDYTLIGRLLDEGMLGIIVPMVHTPEDAKAAADACRFPPVGERSWGWGRARVYGCRLHRLDQRAALCGRTDRERFGGGERGSDHGHAWRQRLLDGAVRSVALYGFSPQRDE